MNITDAQAWVEREDQALATALAKRNATWAELDALAQVIARLERDPDPEQAEDLAQAKARHAILTNLLGALDEEIKQCRGRLRHAQRTLAQVQVNAIAQEFRQAAERCQSALAQACQEARQANDLAHQIRIKALDGAQMPFPDEVERLDRLATELNSLMRRYT